MNKDAIKNLAKDKLKQTAKLKIIAIVSSVGCLPLILIIFAVFAILVIFAGADFGTESEASSSIASSSTECGFTISTTSLTKEEYKTKLEEYAKSNSKAKVFAENADSIYDLSLSSNRNPELVIIRAAVEGFSPGESYNNYWGIGCYNNAGITACKNYNSFLEGVQAFLNNISKYETLIDMMQSYAYIGDYWVKGSGAAGGCYYFNDIKDYYDTSTEAQKSKQTAEETCAAGGSSSVKTTTHDQTAYARWQVNKNMASMRNKIFSLTDENATCVADGEVSNSISELINLSDSEAWKAITGISTSSKPKSSQISENMMDKRVTTITIPYRTWASGDDEVIGTVGGYNVTKKEQKLTVNKALAELFETFFTDVYNNAPEFVIKTFAPCYDYRTNVNNSSSMSAHAFGAACDINPNSPGNSNEETPYKTWASVEKNVSGKSKYETIYKESKVIQIAHKYTITNGVDWNNPKDAMHFSFIGDKTREQSKEIAGLK